MQSREGLSADELAHQNSSAVLRARVNLAETRKLWTVYGRRRQNPLQLQV